MATSGVDGSLSAAEALRSQAYKKNDEGNSLAVSGVCCALPIGIALFVITCVAASGAMSGVAFGGCMIGLGVPGVLTSVLASLGNKKAAVAVGCLATITIVVQSVLGALVIAGFIPPVTMAWISLGLTFGAAALACSAVSSLALVASARSSSRSSHTRCL
ncbi:MAG: hypothetical protein S4CHLAM2_12110 [Chlamydiales bacterium]|nr:hypothetical protein [Chlamydiales bacterium]